MAPEIPVVDIGPFLAGGDGASAAREIEAAATRVGFHEHADGNTLTLLHQRGDHEGLQVSRLDTPGEWTSRSSRTPSADVW